MKVCWKYGFWLLVYGLLSLLVFSCSSMHQLDALPDGSYVISRGNYAKLAGKPTAGLPAKIKAGFEWQDSVLLVVPHQAALSSEKIPVRSIRNVRLNRRTFDLNILTVPFKIRPSVAGFPQQLNADFSAAMYLGRRYDFYSLGNMRKNSASTPQISAYGLGYGGFLGLGSVTMNSFVTRNKIDYEYDGFTLNAGLAVIYDPKRFNLGLAIGADYLLDRNRKAWIYQGKPWFGLLFGLNLN